MHVVIVGNGVAGIEAALAVRNREPGWDVTVVSEESDNFFSRTALMWVFCGQMSHRDIEPYERDLYDNAGLRRVRARAVGLDTGKRELRLAGGLDPIPYDRLLVACGSRPRPGPWDGTDRRGIGHFVTIQDLEWFEKEVHGGPGAGRPPRPDAHREASEEGSPYWPREVAAEARGRLAQRPSVIGGGLIGIEAVEVAAAAKLPVRFFIREEYFWPMAIERRESTWITDRMAEHGVEVCLEHDVQRLEGDDDGNVERVITNHGEYPTDLVVVAIGVVPNTAWLKGSGVELDERSGGILVDQRLETNVEGVFAAGDCASVPWFDGVRRPEQLWYTARDQGRVAARALLGDDVQYDRGIWYNSAKLMDIEYTTAGIVNMKLKGERNWFYEETGKVRSTTRIVVVDGKVVGFNLLGRRWDHSVLIRWIEEGRSLDWVLDHLREASFDTELVPPLKIPRSARKQELEGPADSPIRGARAFPYR